MINPLDLRPHLDAVLIDVSLAIQAEQSTLDYEAYLAYSGKTEYDDDLDQPEIDEIRRRIDRLMTLWADLSWYNQVLHRWHR